MSNTVIVQGIKLVKNPNPEIVVTLKGTGMAILKVSDAKAEACVLSVCMPLSPKRVWNTIVGNSNPVAQPILSVTLTCQWRRRRLPASPGVGWVQ